MQKICFLLKKSSILKNFFSKCTNLLCFYRNWNSWWLKFYFTCKRIFLSKKNFESTKIYSSLTWIFRLHRNIFQSHWNVSCFRQKFFCVWIQIVKTSSSSVRVNIASGDSQGFSLIISCSFVYHSSTSSGVPWSNIFTWPGSCSS